MRSYSTCGLDAQYYVTFFYSNIYYIKQISRYQSTYYCFFFSPSAGDFIKCQAKAKYKLTVSCKPRSTSVLFETSEYCTVLCTGLLVSIHFWWQMDRRKTQSATSVSVFLSIPIKCNDLMACMQNTILQNVSRIYFKITQYIFII